MIKEFIIKNKAVLDNLISFVNKNWGEMARVNKPMVATLSEFKKKRTIKQNKRYWGKGILSQIAEKAWLNGRQYNSECWHEFFKQKFIGVVELPNGRLIGKSSTGLSTREFMEFSDEVEAYATSELGVEFEDLPIDDYSGYRELG